MTPSEDPEQIITTAHMKFGQDQYSESDYSVNSGDDTQNLSDKTKKSLTQRANASISRKLPVFADAIIFVLQVFIFAGFLYFAYIYPDLNQTIPCIADSESESPIPPGSVNDGMNVTDRFRCAIRFGFWISSINIVRAVIAQIGLWKNIQMLIYVSFVIYGLNMCLALVLFIFMQIWRWSNSGEICSGKYLPAGAKQEEYPNYLIEEGKFLKIVLITIYSIFAVACFTVCCLAVFFS